MLFNDIKAYEFYLQKITSLVAMQKLLNTNTLSGNSDLNVGICLVNAFDTDFGKILMANPALLKATGHTISEIKNAKISAI